METTRLWTTLHSGSRERMLLSMARLFTTEHLNAAGVTRHRIDWLCSRGKLVRVSRGVFLEAASEPDPTDSYRALLTVLPDRAVLSHLTAARVFGIDLLPTGSPVHVAVPAGATPPRRRGVRVHRQHLSPEDRTLWLGLRCTDPVRTAIDLARTLPFVEAVVAMDALLHTGRCTAALIERRLAAMRGWPGCRSVREVLQLAEPAAESPMESRLRVLWVQAGLPPPVAQHTVLDSAGAFLARVDLALPELRIAGGYDGEVHLQSDMFAKDRRRQNQLLSAGWLVLRWTSGDVYQRPESVAADVRAAIALRSAEGETAGGARADWAASTGLPVARLSPTG